jgi:hypothetical protein
MAESQELIDKLFITEILNDIHRNGYMEGGKAYEMLHDWARELRNKAGIPRSKLRPTFNRIVGSYNW